MTKGHHPALPYPKLPEFIATLRTQEAGSARALEFTILTAARSGEVTGATWSEFDTQAKLWTVPKERMKRGQEHTVPLSGAAVDIIDAMALGSDREPGAYVFPGLKANKPTSHATMRKLIRNLGYTSITTHGFRATFKTWAGDATNYPRDLAELALSHAVGNEVEEVDVREGSIRIPELRSQA